MTRPARLAAHGRRAAVLGSRWRPRSRALRQATAATALWDAVCADGSNRLLRRRMTLRLVRPALLGRRGRRRRRRVAAAATARVGLPQPPAGLAGAAGCNGFARTVAAAIARYGAHRVGVVLGYEHLGHPQHRVGLRPSARDTGTGRRTSTTAEPIRSTRCAASAPKCWACRGPMVDDLDGLLVQRQGLPDGAALDRTAGLIDAAVVGGVDSLCLSTLHGFDALQLLSDDICRPFDAARKRHLDRRGGRLRAARPAGRRRQLARRRRVQRRLAHVDAASRGPGRAGRHARSACGRRAWRPADIGYVNAHGTATPANDRAEAAALDAVFGAGAACRCRRPRASPATRWARPASSKRSSPCRRSSSRSCRQSANLRDARPGAGARPGHAAARSAPAPCDEQQLRLRRQQLLAGLRHGRIDVSRCSSIFMPPACWHRASTSLADLLAACRRGEPSLPAPPAARCPAPQALPAERAPARQPGRAPDAGLHRAGAAGEPVPDRPAAHRCSRPTKAPARSASRCSRRWRRRARCRRCCSRNSVHNAPSGYFSIAYRNRQSATVVSLGLESFASGLLCAASEAAGQRPAGAAAWPTTRR